MKKIIKYYLDKSNNIRIREKLNVTQLSENFKFSKLLNLMLTNFAKTKTTKKAQAWINFF